MRGTQRWLLAVVAGACLATGAAATPDGFATRARAAGDATDVIATYRQRIPELMAEQHVPGLAVALVDGDQVLWTEGFGHLDGDESGAVDEHTAFGVQSMSKVFTATAVMRAVQDGRLDLDVPIATYLPEFTVHSAFEAHPERKITLRMLLGHTAGLTHEAPIGNNNELDPGTFETHVRSISDTWLRFPVGTGYAYSNLGVDLAGFILERVYDAPFAQVMDDLLLRPLGMTESTFDRGTIAATADRALGHAAPMPVVPLDVPMSASGGLYASASDLARFLRFQLNDGSLDGRTVLDPARVTELRTVPAPNAGAVAGYALGVARTRWRATRMADLFSHGGGGYGFLADLWWAPQLQVGIAVLTNSSDHDLQGRLAVAILGDLVHQPGTVYADRLAALPAQSDVVEPDGHFVPPDGLAARIAGLGVAPASADAARWAGYAGEYKTIGWGIVNPMPPSGRFLVGGGSPWYESDADGVATRHRLSEIEPGLFLAENGEALDMRGQPPTWRNLELRRVGGPTPWQWALLGLVVVVAAGWLVAAAVATVRRRRAGAPGVGRLLGALAALTALLVLAAAALVAAMPGLADAGFLGWLEFPAGQRLALHVPLALAVAAACLAVLLVARWRSQGPSRAVPPRHAALAVAALVLTVQLAAWHMIGWGLS